MQFDDLQYEKDKPLDQILLFLHALRDRFPPGGGKHHHIYLSDDGKNLKLGVWAEDPEGAERIFTFNVLGGEGFKIEDIDVIEELIREPSLWKPQDRENGGAS